MVPEPADDMKTSKRVLEPYDRISEVLFGLIMVLSITGSLSVADAGRDDVRTMLIGALGCNLAWGIIDGLLVSHGLLERKGKWHPLVAGLAKGGGPGRRAPLNCRRATADGGCHAQPRRI